MIEQHIVYRYLWRDEARHILAHRVGDVVTCSDLETGRPLGEYVLDGDTLSGPGDLSETRRQGVATELRRCEPVAWQL